MSLMNFNDKTEDKTEDKTDLDEFSLAIFGISDPCYHHDFLS